MMEGFRENPPKEIAGSKVKLMNDYKLSRATDVHTGKVTPIEITKSDVLQFFLEDGTKISMRPSGTEPKIKFYFSYISFNTSEISSVISNHRAAYLASHSDDRLFQILKLETYLHFSQ